MRLRLLHEFKQYYHRALLSFVLSKYELETFQKINSSNVQIDFSEAKNDGHKFLNAKTDQCHLKEPQ